MTRILAALLLTAAPAHAASGPFFSLQNTNFTVLIAFVVFVGILIYFKVPGLLGGLLDKRADRIRDELDIARRLHDDARALLADYERKLHEARDQVDRIVAAARDDAAHAAEAAKADLQTAIARRLHAAEEQIASAEAAALREVRERAIGVAIGAAGELLSAELTGAKAGKLIDAAIDEVGRRLN